jgi:very-short-patch-repair endonuclease
MQHLQRHGNRENVRELRMSPTDAEKELWNLLRGRRFHRLKFRRQHRIGMNILDFYCPALRLAIELDGEHHFTEDGKRWDKVRDAMLAEQGIRVIHIENCEFLRKPYLILDAIEEARRNSPLPGISILVCLLHLLRGEGKVRA